MNEVTVFARSAIGALAPGKEIQWMPPGRHTVWPDGFESAFDIEVTPRIAELANRDLQELRQRAAAGRGNWPYGDFDHEDREQSFEPIEFFWGGSDPKNGGVRLRVKWSAPGEQAVQGKAFRSFSPRWRMLKDNHQFLGIGLNVGGLVNRSAFKSIQSVAAKGASGTSLASMTAEEIQAHAESLAEANGTLMDEELNEILRSNPTCFETVRAAIIAGTFRQQQSSAARGRAGVAEAEFIVQAREFGRTNDIADECEAQAKFTETAEGNRSYRSYRYNVVLVPVTPAKKPDQVTATPPHAFLVKAKEFAAANRVQDECEAQARFAGTAEGQELYRAYRRTFL